MRSCTAASNYCVSWLNCLLTKGLPLALLTLITELHMSITNPVRTLPYPTLLSPASWHVMILLAVWIGLPLSVAQAESPPAPVGPVVADGAELKPLADHFRFTEGPAADQSGNVYFTDQPNDQILRWSVSGEIRVFLEPSGRSNGLFFAPNGKLIACADADNELWEIDMQGQHRVLAKNHKGKAFNGPNDCWVDRDGTIYFTDPLYQRPYWSMPDVPRTTESVFRVRGESPDAVLVANGFKKPNGIVGDASRRLLFVADIRDNKTYMFRITDDQQLTDRKLFCPQGSDGMTLDDEGNVYLTGRDGVTVWNRDGVKRQTIEVPQRWTANVTIGGKSGRTLFITAGPACYTIELKTTRVDFMEVSPPER